MAGQKKTQKKEKLNKKTSKAVEAPKKVKSKTVKKTKKTSNKKSKSELKSLNSNVSSPKFYDQLKLSESYISLVLGGVVVIGASVLFLIFLREARKPQINKPEVLNSSTLTPVVTKAPVKTYTMQENETLWDVAVREYGDGFRYVDIINANKFENPDFVPPGTVIIIPIAK